MENDSVWILGLFFLKTFDFFKYQLHASLFSFKSSIENGSHLRLSEEIVFFWVKHFIFIVATNCFQKF